jgi:hypothetical protein
MPKMVTADSDAINIISDRVGFKSVESSVLIDASIK